MSDPLYSHAGTDYYEGDRIAYGPEVRWGIVAPRVQGRAALPGTLWARFHGPERLPTYIDITKVVRHEPAARVGHGHDDSVQ